MEKEAFPASLRDKEASIKTYWSYGIRLACYMNEKKSFTFSYYKIEEQDQSDWDRLFGENAIEKNYVFRALPFYKVQGQENMFRFWYPELQRFFSQKH